MICVNLILEKLVILKSVFKEGGMVIVGNVFGINDGVFVIILMLKEKVVVENIFYIVIIKVIFEVGVDLVFMGYVLYYVVNEVLIKGGYFIDDIDLFYLNEVFVL